MGDKDNQDKSTDDQDKQTVTIEQFEELQQKMEAQAALLEETKKAQSGSDKTNTELRKELKLKDKESENSKKTEQQKFADDLAEINTKLAETEKQRLYETNKNIATQMLVDKKRKVPRTLDRFIGKDEEETRKLINLYIEDEEERELEYNDNFVKNNGRIVAKSNSKTGLTYEEIQALSPSDYAKLDQETINKAMEAALGVN